MAHPQIATFARLAKASDVPIRKIFGQATKLARTMHDIRYNEVRDEIYVGNPFAQAILTFRGIADGNEGPVRIIQGSRTKLNKVDTLDVDIVNDEVIVPHGNTIVVHDLTSNGNVPPLRVIEGGADMGWRSGAGIGVDWVHDVMVTDGSPIVDGKRVGGSRASILIFDREADGPSKPVRIIGGPKSGILAIRQMVLHPENGWIVIAQITSGSIPEPDGTYVGVFSIYDNGDVPPRWKIDGIPSNGMKKPRGVTLNPNHKEVIVSDMRMNAVLTFSFPEIFDIKSPPLSR